LAQNNHSNFSPLLSPSGGFLFHNLKSAEIAFPNTIEPTTRIAMPIKNQKVKFCFIFPFSPLPPPSGGSFYIRMES